MENFKYTTQDGRQVSKSAHHEDMYIVDCADGKTFYTINASKEYMLKTFKPKVHGAHK